LRKILGLILLLPFVAAAQPEQELAPGRVLIADKDLHDPNFEQTVIVLLSYDEEGGAGGLILNRPSEILVSQALKELPEARGNHASAYEGGPVQTKKVLALLRTTDKLDDADEVVPGVYTVGTTRLLRKALTDKLDIRVFAGYAGWGPGQLEAEVDAGAWHVGRGAAAMLFDEDPESLWQRLVRKLDAQIARARLRYGNALSSAPGSGHDPGSVSSSGFVREVASTGARRNAKGRASGPSKAAPSGRAPGNHRI
jgi:putative transcriptional regulator